jgi:bifunctional UDP-N-acetylglucosamine pyrophosphorylase / glucosamine-1-phosphate N-acetyltransferase
MSVRTIIVVLAAGEGTRMVSDMPKVLHRIAGKSLIAHVLDAARAGGADRIAVVVGPGSDDVAKEVRHSIPTAEIFVQKDRRGTAHAVLAARAAIQSGDDLIVVFGDTPLLRAEILQALRDALKVAPMAVLGFRTQNPTGYGRLIMENDKLIAIREETDANTLEQTITLCNAGVMALSAKHALRIIGAIRNQNRKQEFYLSDAVTTAASMGLHATVVEASEEDVMGVNDKKQLSEAESAMQKRLRESAMAAGVTLVAPETVYFSSDTKLGRDVVIEPNVIFGPGVVVEDKATIRSFSYLEGAHVGLGASVGPFARLRPGTELGAGTKIGNFVETKAAVFGKGAKANHLSYIGDASVGESANVGAGTITCNYDGYEKYRTEIGKGAFIGTNSSLVAPVKIGEGAYIGAASVIVKDVPADALALGRGKQVVKKGWAKMMRARKKARKPKDADD